jgi:hypothetical protein
MIAYPVSNGDDCRLMSLLPHPAISEDRWSPTGYARFVYDPSESLQLRSSLHNRVWLPSFQA